MRYIDMADIRQRSLKGDRFWFSSGAMRFFRGRVAQGGYATGSGRLIYFVSSEQFDASSPRLYTVRVMDWQTGRVDSASEFQQYASWSGADKAARRHAGWPR